MCYVHWKATASLTLALLFYPVSDFRRRKLHEDGLPDIVMAMQQAIPSTSPARWPRTLFDAGDIHPTFAQVHHTICYPYTHYLIRMSSPSQVVDGVIISSNPADCLGPPAPWFFDYIFDSLEYDRWVKSVPSRLLRLVGGPGSGKTSFAALAVNRLRQNDQAHHNHQKPPLVLSVFLKPLTVRDASAAVHQEQNAIPFGVQFLAEIEKQIDAKIGVNSDLSPPPSPQTQIDGTALLNSIRFKLFRLSDVWLVVDDLDCLWPIRKEYLEVEERLEQLRGIGVRVLLTSRTPFQLSTQKPICDVSLENEYDHDEEQHEGRPGLIAWWECNLDHDSTGGPFWICQKCKEAGYACGNE